MSKITYADKSKTGGTPIDLWRDIDANEVKNVVNANDDAVIALAAVVDQSVNSVQFDITPTALTAAEGLLQWNATDGTLNLGMSGGAVTMQIGQEMFTKVVNKTGSTILNGKLVYINGRLGLRPTIALAKGDSETTAKVIGMATQDILTNEEGYICTTGYVRGIKTDYATFAEGQMLWLSKATAGEFTNVQPTIPNHSDVIGNVGVVHPTAGSIFINLSKHFTLTELSDVNGTPLTTSGQIPVWNQTSGYFDFTDNINNKVPLSPTGDITLTFPSQKTLFFSQPTYRDEYPAMVIPASGAAAPDEVGHTIGGVARTLRGFDGNATQEILSGSFEIPHGYMIGETIEVHVHFRPSTTGTGTIIWYFDYEYSPPNAAPIPQVTLSATETISSDKQYHHLVLSFGNLPQPSTPFMLGGKIGFNIRRTPTTDTYAGDALLEQVALHVPYDTAGSRQIYIK